MAGLTLGQQRPWTLIESDDPTIPLGEGTFSDWPTLLAAAGAFARSRHPFKRVLFDDDVTVRELDDHEEEVLAMICACYGLDVEDA